jgi:starch synthase
MPNILFVASEVYPLVKTGGLGDVAAALPVALREIGVDVRLLLPGYPSVMDAISPSSTHLSPHLLPTIDAVQICRGVMPETGVPVYVLDCPKLYRREGGPYHDTHGSDWWDNEVRFAALSKAAAFLGQIGHELDFPVDLIHCNDWQTGLTPAYQQYLHGNQPASLISIHNIAYQGLYGANTVPALGLPWDSFGVQGVEFYGLLSFLKAGLFYADWINTVSPTYAKEIQTPDYGYGLHGLLSQRRDALTGILNGIDEQQWNPLKDQYLNAPFSADNLAGKELNKNALRKRLGLSEENPNKPLFGMITRLTHQKGIDLVIPIITTLIQEGAQFAILGNGDKHTEHQLRDIAMAFPDQINVTLGYDEALAHQIEAGSDIFLMPSRFEPCGLTQMYSMHYGTIPIVRKTGGLADTVVNVSPSNIDNETATGFVFERENSDVLLQTALQAMLLYRNRELWQQLQRHGMRKDFSWKHSAHEYLNLYNKLIYDF